MRQSQPISYRWDEKVFISMFYRGVLVDAPSGGIPTKPRPSTVFHNGMLVSGMYLSVQKRDNLCFILFFVV